jgi:hypothetical protein
LEGDLPKKGQGKVKGAKVQSGEGDLIKNVEIFRAGDYTPFGKKVWTPKDVEEMDDNFHHLKSIGEHPAPPVKTTHLKDNRGNPMIAWVEDVRAKAGHLFADFITTSKKVSKLIRNKGLRFRSAEIHTDEKPWVCMDGTKMKNVIRGVAFVPVPQVKGLPDIEECQITANFADGQSEEFETVNFQEEIPMSIWRHKTTGKTTTEDMSANEYYELFEEKTEPEGDTKPEGEGGEAGDPKPEDKKEGDGAGDGDAKPEDKPAEDDKPTEGEEKPTEEGKEGEGATENNDDPAKGEEKPEGDSKPDGEGESKPEDKKEDGEGGEASPAEGDDAGSGGEEKPAEGAEGETENNSDEEGTLDFAELSSEDRDKLGKDQFAGPNRSFPVPDCTHYANALARMWAFKGTEDDRRKIERNIVRMGLKLKCGTAEDRADELNLRRGSKMEEFADDIQCEGLWFGDDLEPCKDGICKLPDLGKPEDKKPEDKKSDAVNFGDVSVPTGPLTFEMARSQVENMDMDALKDQIAKANVVAFEADTKESESWTDRMISEGRMTPAQRDDGVKLAGPESKRLVEQFEDGKTETYADRFRRFVESGAKVVSFDELGMQDGPDSGLRNSSSEKMSDEEAAAHVERIKKGEAPE